MFPVSLEFNDGSFLTADPPCYGFLRDEQWTDDYQNLVEGIQWSDYADELDIEAGTTDEYDISLISAIWNTGTYFGELDSEGNTSNIHSSYRDNVKNWSASSGIPVTMRDVMTLFEKNLDKDSSSCILWAKDDAYMGVSADVSCDRALFYLMLNRMLNTTADAPQSRYLLDLIYKKSLPPVVALLLTRMICPTQLWNGITRNVWAGSDGDSCIIPMHLMYKGMGKLYQQPVQIDWIQHEYTTGRGHLRDEDFEEVYQFCGEYGNWASRSMFDAILQQKYIYDEKEGSVILCDQAGERVYSIAIDFAKEVMTEQAANQSLFGGDAKRFSYQRVIGNLTHIESVSLKVDFYDWEPIALALLLGE